ncbi:poly-gamma-glutamate biosynthesis protein [Acrocarpospora pleiomorpha]|uniref:Poly-gamma-glutamate biosynthesis protein n=1 Tax=Acrocarpospora pleiomorpha TaxID=90975 RepID=A0A5M3XGQ8_9ACTN|nr:poly-gamma-glutamate biosynthesis protein [Acrocarpospora pleiomorpha]
MVVIGDLNFMNVTDPAGPLRRVRGELEKADVRFANLECCFVAPRAGRSVDGEGFHADPAVAVALRDAGIDAVGTANNVNYGTEAITSSIRTLDECGVAHAGSGVDAAAAFAPVVVTVAGGVRIGFLQRTAVYWPTDHEAGPRSPGVAAFRCHTAYRVPMHKTHPEIPPLNRPGVPPEVITWPDRDHLDRLRADVAALRDACDIVVVSLHWGLKRDVLSYMKDIAHAVIDEGADVVMGHGPHFALPVELYHGKPIFYGLGSFSFHTGHYGREHGDWAGLLGRVDLDGRDVMACTLRLVRHNDVNETYFCDPADESDEINEIAVRMERLGSRLEVDGDVLVVKPASVG